MAAALPWELAARLSRRRVRWRPAAADSMPRPLVDMQQRAGLGTKRDWAPEPTSSTLAPGCSRSASSSSAVACMCGAEIVCEWPIGSGMSCGAPAAARSRRSRSCMIASAQKRLIVCMRAEWYTQWLSRGKRELSLPEEPKWTDRRLLLIHSFIYLFFVHSKQAPTGGGAKRAERARLAHTRYAGSLGCSRLSSGDRAACGRPRSCLEMKILRSTRRIASAVRALIRSCATCQERRREA